MRRAGAGGGAAGGADNSETSGGADDSETAGGADGAGTTGAVGTDTGITLVGDGVRRRERWRLRRGLGADVDVAEEREAVLRGDLHHHKEANEADDEGDNRHGVLVDIGNLAADRRRG